ncbi:MAG TPA: hypothetical protein VF792_05335 [Ktedonobacterales bacterium]
MSQQHIPPTHARLIDGREFRVEADGAHVDERVHAFAQMQEARLLFLRPETLGLRMSNVGQVEYSFANPGDGMAALEAIYQHLPELRRADTPPPAPEAPPNYFAPIAPPEPTPAPAPSPIYAPDGRFGSAPYGSPQPRYPGSVSGMYALPPAPIPFPQATLDAYGPDANTTHAELTPTPRTAGQLIGNAFRLYGKRFGALFTLTLLVATLPMMLTALANALLMWLGGDNPLAGTPSLLPMLQQALNGQTPTTPTTTSATATTPLTTFIGLAGLVVAILSLLVLGWSQATLTVGAREATLGRPIDLRACAREGLSRAWATLMSQIVLYALLFLVAAPGLGMALALALTPNVRTAGVQFTPADATGFYVAAGLIAILTLVFLAYIWTRFALYPITTALGMQQPLRHSLALTAFGWWRVFAALLVVTLFTSLFSVSSNLAQFVSVALSAVALAPLAQLIAGPVGALVRVGILYDQRLRREGYALFQQEGITQPSGANDATPAKHGSEVHR